MTTQISGVTAILVSETDATSYFVGGTFTLGGGPFTDLAFTASDDETDFAALGAQSHESFGAGRQQGLLSDGNGATVDQGLTSLEDVLVLTDPETGAEITVGRVTIREDTGQSGGGATTQDFYIFSAPINPNITYSITSIEYTPGASADTRYQYSTFDNSAVVCFANGTLIATASGQLPVEQLRKGMRVQTCDGGLREVIWIGRQDVHTQTMAVNPKVMPVRIEPGVLGNQIPLFVSQQHRILVGDAFVKAKHLAMTPGFSARLASRKRNLSYFHLLLEDHHVLFANGIGAESLYLGAMARGVLQNKSVGPLARFRIAHASPGRGGLARAMKKEHEVAEHILGLSQSLRRVG